eukprot:390866-Prorocentrum_minimum.AAC.2
MTVIVLFTCNLTLKVLTLEIKRERFPYPVEVTALGLHEENIEAPAVRGEIHEERDLFPNDVVLDKQLPVHRPVGEFKASGGECKASGGGFNASGGEFKASGGEFKASGVNSRPQGVNARPQGVDSRPRGVVWAGEFKASGLSRSQLAAASKGRTLFLAGWGATQERTTNGCGYVCGYKLT